MNVSQIEEQVGRNLDREGVSKVTGDIGTWVAAELREWADEAVWPPPKPSTTKEPGRFRPGDPHNWSFLADTDEFSTIASQQTYNLSTDLLRPVRCWLEMEVGTRLRYLELEAAEDLYYGRGENRPEAYSIVFAENDATAPVLWLFPVPNEAWDGHLRHQRKATVISGSSSNWFTIRYPDGIIAGATARGLRRARQYAEAGEEEAIKVKFLGQAIAADRKAESEGAMTLGISTVADGDPEDPRPIMNEQLSGWPGRPIDPDSYY